MILGDEGREARGEGRGIPGLAPRPVPLVPQEDVGRLEIAVNHAIGVGDVDGPRQGLDELGRRTYRLGRALEVLGQAAAGHELEDEVRPARGLADVVNLDDVGMLQAGERRGLRAEAGQVLRAGLEPGQDHLQRHGAIEAELPGLVHDAHTAAAEQPQDLVAGDLGQGLRPLVRRTERYVPAVDRRSGRSVPAVRRGTRESAGRTRRGRGRARGAGETRARRRSARARRPGRRSVPGSGPDTPRPGRARRPAAGTRDRRGPAR